MYFAYDTATYGWMFTRRHEHLDYDTHERTSCFCSRVGSTEGRARGVETATGGVQTVGMDGGNPARLRYWRLG